MMANRNKKLMLGSNRQVRSSCKQWAGDWYILHLFNQKADWQTCCVLCLFCVMVQAIWGAKMSKLWKSHQVGILQHLGGYFCAAMSDFMFFLSNGGDIGGIDSHWLCIGTAGSLSNSPRTHRKDMSSGTWKSQKLGSFKFSWSVRNARCMKTPSCYCPLSCAFKRWSKCWVPSSICLQTLKNWRSGTRARRDFKAFIGHWMHQKSWKWCDHISK